MEFHRVNRRLYEFGTVVDYIDLYARRRIALDFREQRLDPVDHLDRVGSRLTEYPEPDIALTVQPALDPCVLDPVLRPADVRKAHGHPILVRNDEVVEAARALELARGLDREIA